MVSIYFAANLAIGYILIYIAMPLSINFSKEWGKYTQNILLYFDLYLYKNHRRFFLSCIVRELT